MFNIDQIKAAHSKVKSGADYPNYVKEIIQSGVTSYESYVSDGHAVFFDADHNQAIWEAKYPVTDIADTCNKEQFTADLKAHQQGKTDYPTFCKDCAVSGIEKWVVDLAKNDLLLL